MCCCAPHNVRLFAVDFVGKVTALATRSSKDRWSCDLSLDARILCLSPGNNKVQIFIDLLCKQFTFRTWTNWQEAPMLHAPMRNFLQ